jgi:hypothetical protein
MQSSCLRFSLCNERRQIVFKVFSANGNIDDGFNGFTFISVISIAASIFLMAEVISEIVLQPSV